MSVCLSVLAPSIAPHHPLIIADFDLIPDFDANLKFVASPSLIMSQPGLHLSLILHKVWLSAGRATVATLIATSSTHAHVSFITCISPLISSGPILIVITLGSGLEQYH